MNKQVPKDAFQGAPVAIIGLSPSGKVGFANDEALIFLECESPDLIDNPDWMEWMFADGVEGWKSKLFKGSRSYVSGEISTRKGNKKYVRIRKNDKSDMIVLMDLTDLHEDTLVLQAGYDEFMKVTMELENALSVIEKQNAQLEKQRDKLNGELKIARKIQTQVFSVDFSKFHPIKVAGFYEAMDDLGGDMYLLHQSEDCFTAIIGDVMGHGVAASLISIAARTIFQKHIESENSIHQSLAEICMNINTEIIDITQGDYYITVGAFRIQKDNRIEYITCGHPPLLLYQKTQKADSPNQLFISQPMLGIFPTINLVSESLYLDPGDRILLFTDCLMEAFDAKENVIDPEVIYSLLSNEKSTTPKDAIEYILKYHEEFTGSLQKTDDLAMICVEIAQQKKAASLALGKS